MPRKNAWFRVQGLGYAEEECLVSFPTSFLCLGACQFCSHFFGARLRISRTCGIDEHKWHM